MPSVSKKRQKSAKKNNKHITTTFQSPPTFQLQGGPDDLKLFQERENSLDINSLKAQKEQNSAVRSVFASNHKEMDESEKNHNLEETRKVELESDENIIVIEGDVADDNSETLKETHDDNGDDESTVLDQRSIHVGVDSEEPKEEDEVVLDSTEPVVESLSEECSTQVPTEVVESESKEVEEKTVIALPSEVNGVFEPPVMDVVSKGTEPSLDESETNEVSYNIVNNLVPKGVESSTDENNECEASSVVMDSTPKDGFEETKLPASDVNGSSRESSVAVANAANILQPAVDIPGNGGENCNASIVHNGTRNQPYISVIPSPVQRTSWRGCCGLFEVLRRSNH